MYNRLLHKQIKGVSTDTLRQMEKYPWPGNVRELENMVQKGMVLCAGECLSVDCAGGLYGDGLFSPLCQDMNEYLEKLTATAFSRGELLPDLVMRLEQKMIRQALEKTKGNQVQAAQLIGISRNTLRKKIN